MPDGRTIVEGLDVPKSMKMSDFMKGFVYEYKIKVFMASLSAKVIELLKIKFGLDMKAIYRFELEELQLMDVESDLPAASSLSSTTEENDDDE
ncbi:MAG: trimethylamine methyltransferase family protein, partial [Thermoproteota archaeon]|nr:trimethylamine methyltransferase family protein [Thermoproteota archaeon]